MLRWQRTGAAAMLRLILGLVIFVGGHSIAAWVPRLRERGIASLGAQGWRGLYSLVSVLGLYLIISGFAAARAQPAVLYVAPPWLHWATIVLMLPVFPLLLAAYLPGRIQRTLKHPMLAAVKLWATAHLLANGTLADVLLFGGLLAWAVWMRISLKRRPPRPVPGAPPRPWNDALAVVLGLAMYGATLGWLHRALFGVAPLP
jgi:uncharacterized membrane protein